MTAIGDALKREREARGFTQGQAAEFLGVSRPFVNQVEAGTKVPADRDLVTFLATFLRLETTDDVDFLCGRIPPDLEGWLTSDLEALRFVRHCQERWTVNDPESPFAGLIAESRL